MKREEAPIIEKHRICACEYLNTILPVSPPSARFHIFQLKGYKNYVFASKAQAGIEPTIFCLRDRRSTTKLLSQVQAFEFDQIGQSIANVLKLTIINKRNFPDRESNPGRRCENAKSLPPKPLKRGLENCKVMLEMLLSQALLLGNKVCTGIGQAVMGNFFRKTKN